VRNAAQKGILVIAAAGNEVKRAKFPAMCPEAIAIAGSTFNEEPWEGSAGAPEVVAAAPAEGVWTASVMNGAYCLDASSGTSFATALVAGVAAEWVRQVRARGSMPANPTAAFKEALRRTARPWKNSSWRNKFGAGIVDMSALMKATLP
jgi:subtilisin family serine protease